MGRFGVLYFTASLLFSGSIARAESLVGVPEANCNAAFAQLSVPHLNSSGLQHILNGNFRNEQLRSGLHTRQGVEKFKDKLMRERKMSRGAVDAAVKITGEMSPQKPSVLQINPEYFPESKALQKSIFPRGWSIAKIVESIKTVATHPSEVATLKSGNHLMIGIYSGVRIELEVTPAGVIETAHPSFQKQ